MAGILQSLARPRRVVAALVVALGVPSALVAAPAALAESATSSTKMLTVSVPPPVIAGGEATYTMTVTNPTASQLLGVTAQALMPEGMTVKNLRGCERLGGGPQTVSFMCIMPNIAPGATESATVTLLASRIGLLEIPFNVSGAYPVGAGTLQFIGDSVTLPVNVQPGPTDIQVTGSSNNGSPPVGSQFSYTWQVKNNGPLPAFGVTFDDPLPAAILLGSLTSELGICSANPVTNSVHCNIGNLPVGQQSTISFTARPNATGIYPNTASIAMLGTDTHLENNKFTVTVQPK